MNYSYSELITWSNTFACGIKLIDDQHRHLVNLVNEMHRHVTGDPEEEQEYFNKVVHETEKYVKIHFATEEKIMIAANFSGYAEHKMAHDKFIITVKKYISDFSTGKRLSLYSYTQFLKDWVLSHIAVMDKQYFVYFKHVATNKNIEKLNITLKDIQSDINTQKDEAYRYTA